MQALRRLLIKHPREKHHGGRPAPSGPEIPFSVRFVSAPGPIFFRSGLGMGKVGELEFTAPILISIATAQLTVGIVFWWLSNR